MFNSSVLEVAIGLVFIYLLLSVLCTAINEAVSSLLNQRGKNLFNGIKNLLNDPGFTGLAQHVYNHGLVSGSTQYAAQRDVNDREPSYLAANVFSLALTDILGAQGVTGKVPDPLPPAVQPAWDALGAAQKNFAKASTVKDAREADLKAAAGEIIAARQGLISALETAATSAALDEKAKSALKLYCLHVEATQAAAQVAKFTDAENRRKASLALQQVLAEGRAAIQKGEEAFASIRAGVQALPAGHTKEALLVLIDKTQREVADGEARLKALQKNIEQWFNDAMDRVGGWYKRWTQKILFVLAAVVVCLTNADTINILQRLDKKGPEVAAIVAAAESTAKSGKLDDDAIEKATKKLDLPLGWNAEEGSPQRFPWSYQGSFWAWDHTHDTPPSSSQKFSCQKFFGSLGTGLLKLTGLATSVFAISLGAPFWFDTLSKFVNLRGAGTPPGNSKKSAPKASGK